MTETAKPTVEYPWTKYDEKAYNFICEALGNLSTSVHVEWVRFFVETKQFMANATDCIVYYDYNVLCRVFAQDLFISWGTIHVAIADTGNVLGNGVAYDSNFKDAVELISGVRME